MTAVFKKDGIYLSLVIPAYNEENRIAESLKRTLGFLEAQPYTFEVVIVDDGSQDRTMDVVKEQFGRNSQVEIEHQARNLGKGEAVKRGMLRGNGKYLFFSDADLSVPIETLSLFLSNLEAGFDITIASRKGMGALIEVHQPIYREFMGKVFTELSTRILGLPVSDFTCGFKGFRREVAKDLFSRQRLKDWSFDAEILYLASLKGYRVREIPVVWRDDRATKVRLWRDVITSFLGLLKIRLNDCLRRYR
ncbi:MAG TPA: dolichyl-phosphate beta-glucosyltransferase [Candidatus Binatia bacterium]|jgi:dolichyl-phosphate beta-glucosyltransferase|nr:dolichyl-phosphate beta-glucosyltransferase [Candidatus Binatia bacterium]